MKILVTPTSLQPDKNPEALRTLQNFTSDLVFNTTGKPLEEDALLSLLKDCDGYLAGLDFVTEKVLASCPKLKAISRYGAGYDRVDLHAAFAQGIVVTNTPGVNAQAVGELAFALLLSIARKIPYLNAQTQSGAWIRSTGTELKGKTIGIMGLGAIGKVVARCASGFGMKIQAYDPYIDKTYCKEHGIHTADFSEVLRSSHAISLHLPLTSATKHLMGADAIAQMLPGAILINTSRGGIIDEAAAYDALITGQLGGLGLDAFEVEPPLFSPLFSLTNVVTTPHTGAHTQEAVAQMASLSVDNLIAVLTNAPCPYIIQPQ
ncbi:MAG: phosphoglycerate dehydrogenase [Lachnospiraceae bacterium]